MKHWLEIGLYKFYLKQVKNDLVFIASIKVPSFYDTFVTNI